MNKLSFQKSIIVYVLILLPIIDMINGYLVVNHFLSAGGVGSPSQIGRFIALLLLVTYMLKGNYNFILVVLFLLLVISFEIHGAFFHQSILGFTIGVTNAYKIFYLFVSLYFFSKLIVTENDFKFFIKILKINLYIVSGSIVFSYIFGVGNSTYGWGGGTKGFFASGNSLGIYIGSLAILYLSLYKHKYVNQHEFYFFLFIPLSLLFLSSKTALILSTLILIYWLFVSRFRYLIVPIFLLSISTYLNDFIEVISLLFEVVISRYNNSADFFSFIASGRNEFVEYALSVFFNSSPSVIRYLIGMGSFISYQNVNSMNIEYDTLETDLFDIFFMYGFVGLYFYFWLFFYLFFCSKNNIIIMFSLFLLFSHSIIAGHVIFNGMSCAALFCILVVSKFDLGANSVEKNN